MFSRKRVNQSAGSNSGDNILNLAGLAKGTQGIVGDVIGSDAIAARLLEMGLTPGTKVSVVGTAPSGDPIEISLRNYRLSLRLS